MELGGAELGVLSTIFVRTLMDTNHRQPLISFLSNRSRVYGQGFDSLPSFFTKLLDNIWKTSIGQKHLGSSMGHPVGYAVIILSTLSTFGLSRKIEHKLILDI